MAPKERTEQRPGAIELAAEFHAAAGIDQDGETDGLAFRGEECDLLRPAIFEEGEILGLQPLDVIAFPVGDLNGDRLKSRAGLKDRDLRLSERQ